MKQGTHCRAVFSPGDPGQRLTWRKKRPSEAWKDKKDKSWRRKEGMSGACRNTKWEGAEGARLGRQCGQAQRCGIWEEIDMGELAWDVAVS